MIRVLIVDDHPVVRQGLKQILEKEPDIVVTREAGDGQQAIDFAGKGECDVVLLDLEMPGKNGLDVLKVLRKDRPKLPVLILSVHPEEQFAARILSAGASGYLTKESAPEELVKAVRRASEGRKYITATLSEYLASELGVTHPDTPHTLLSDREFQVLQMIASGRTVSEIAEEMCLSVKTISTYRARILEKMNMATNAELMRYAMVHRLV